LKGNEDDDSFSDIDDSTLRYHKRMNARADNSKEGKHIKIS
jgi:hypothetical protein